MVVLDRRLSKLEANQPPPPRRSLEEIEADINQLLARAGTTLDAEIAKYGSVQGIIKALKAERQG